MKNIKKTLLSILFCLLTLAWALAAEQFDPPCLYLTWQRSPETTMTIQWITKLDRTDDIVVYHAIDELQWYSIQGIHDQLPENLPYLVHRIELTGLRPDTLYEFKPGADAVAFKFKTMPLQLKAPICFVVGGDVYHDDLGTLAKMNQLAARANPHFALVGGDLAYGTEAGYISFNLFGSFNNRSERWIEWLRAWKKQMVTSDGCLIPLVPAIGNHDTLGRFNQTPRQAAVFYALFPMPGLQGYNVLDFGNYMSLVILDTEHTHPIEGAQTEWLKNVLEMRKDRLHKFALYHVGAYPSVRSFKEGYSVIIRKNWVPSFEKYGLSAAFEHHDHTYKRTYVIKNSKIDPSGVLYIGDGAWGVAQPRKPRKPQERWYLAKTASKQNITIVTIDNSHRQYIALDPGGRIIDSFEQNL